MGQSQWVKYILILLLGLCISCQSEGQSNRGTGEPSFKTDAFINRLMPQPGHLAVTTGHFLLTPAFMVSVVNYRDARLDGAILRTLQTIRLMTGDPLNTSSPGSSLDGQLVISVQGGGGSVQSVDENESYALSVSPTSIRLTSPTVVGAIHGLQTLVQLVQISGTAFIVPAVSIEDSPRFPWRGLMLDCSRHFEPVPVLKRTLDGMAAVKLNVFHWHLTDDQGFRVESKVYPALTGHGSDGLFYNQQEVREIVQYARDRGIRVVPEFEMPGHTIAWLVAYPSLASGAVPDGIRREFGISDAALDPTREETYKFLENFLGEMALLFPDDYVHIGGDETLAPAWKTDPRILAFLSQHQLKDSDALQAYFNQRVLSILTKLKKHMVGWDEILNPALPHDVLIQSWRGEASLVKGAQQGYQGILSAGYYLDAMQPAGTLYLVDPLPQKTNLSASQRALVLGGEICMFAEQVNERTIDSRLWPRSAAIAERFWSQETVANVADMYRRLSAVSLQLEALGIHHLSQQDASLRELAGTQSIEDLRLFASALEPVSFHERYEQQKTSQLTVLNRFVDAVRPDPPSRFEIDTLIRRFLKAPATETAAAMELNTFFGSFQRCAGPVELQVKQRPMLEDVGSRAAQLAGLAQSAQEAIRFLSSTKAAPAGWKQSQLTKIDAARKPGGIVRFTFLDSLEALVNAVPG